MDEETKALIERLREHIPSMRRYKLEHAAHYAEQAADALQAQAERVKALEEELARQCANVAFVVNNVTVPDQWYEKLKRELDEARSLMENTNG